MQGYFESVTRSRVRGWVERGHGAAPALSIVVNDMERIPLGPDCFAPTRPDGRTAFEVPVRLAVGSRVEVIDDATGTALPGGLRFVVASRAPKLRIAIVAPVKSEAPYLLEWIAYHRALGIRQFYLADNDGDDGTSELLQKLDAAGLIVRLDWRGAKFLQLDFYAKVVPCLCGIADIAAVIDADEFLRPLDGRQTIVEAVAELFSSPEVTAVGVNWAMYGSAGRQQPGEGLVIERFTKRAEQNFKKNLPIKTLVRPENFRWPNPNPHFFNRRGGVYTDTRGTVFVWDDFSRLGIAKAVVWNALRLDHYVIKSRDEFEAKMRRGSTANAQSVYNMHHFHAHDVNAVEEPHDPGVVARTKAEIERLRRILARPVSFWRRFDFRAKTIRAKLASAHFETPPA